MKKAASVRRTFCYQLGGLLKNLTLFVLAVVVWLVNILWAAVSPKNISKTYNRYRDNDGKFTWDYVSKQIERYASIESKIRALVFELLDSSYRSFEKPEYPEPNHLDKIHNHYKEIKQNENFS